MLGNDEAPSDTPNDLPSTEVKDESSTTQANNGSHKRGADELESPPSTTTTSPASTDNTNKRARTAHVNTTPSKVIHIRNVPLEATESELYTLCAPFGKVVTALIMKGKGQALVQMQDQIGATALVDFYNANPAVLRNNFIHLQYSTREEITNKPPLHIPGAAVAPPSVLSTSSPPPRESLFGPHSGEPASPPPSSSSSVQPPPPGTAPPESTNESRVLLVNISNVLYPITIDLLYSVFSKYGMVTKIVTFSKTGFQAFVQFSTPEGAEIAKNSLDSQNIYVGCCTLRLNFSNIKDLDIKYNNEKSRDFTNPYLPRSSQSGPSPTELAPAPPINSGYYPPPTPYEAYQPYPPAPYAPPPTAAPPTQHHGGHNSLQSIKSTMGVPPPGTGPVVIISGMAEDKVTPDAIFTLLGVYGDVLKVKILFTKKDTALVQMATPQQAEAVIANLNSAVMYGKQIRINYSKHATIMIPSNNPNEENMQYTKEYLGSPLHRFRNPSKTFKHVCPPSATLHVSSVPPSVAEQELRDLFSQYGQVMNVKFFTSEKRMALLQMENIPDATTALIALHNYKFPDSQIPIRVSFAKSTIYA